MTENCQFRNSVELQPSYQPHQKSPFICCTKQINNSITLQMVKGMSPFRQDSEDSIVHFWSIHNSHERQFKQWTTCCCVVCRSIHLLLEQRFSLFTGWGVRLRFFHCWNKDQIHAGKKKERKEQRRSLTYYSFTAWVYHLTKGEYLFVKDRIALTKLQLSW